MKGKTMLLGSAQEAASYQADTMMVYTGAPQNTRRKAIADMNIPAGQAYMASIIFNQSLSMPLILLTLAIQKNRKTMLLRLNL
ncbi:endonuclease IV [Agrilactobacillus composti DSM 18527 = JCM 14202]|nr:endonuclease IV [Agrilactobacillus composti DSM 18527 = JCM 14202]